MMLCAVLCCLALIRVCVVLCGADLFYFVLFCGVWSVSCNFALSWVVVVLCVRLR